MVTQISTGRSFSKIEDLPQLKLAELIPILAIAGLGFLVDVYDIVLFAVLRVPSLISLGVPAEQSLTTGVFLLNMQMLGMIIGGFTWGVLGDKKGRKAALFGSILLYSLATILNGFITSVPMYALLRFVAGIGLAGEVGAAMVITAEVMPANYRSYGTAAVAGTGVFGAILASYAGDILPWRTAFITAGLIGLLLLFARMSMKETNLFASILHNRSVERGSIKLLFSNPTRILRLIRCFLAAVPLWFVFGVLVSFAPEICSSTNKGVLAVSVAAIALCYSIGETCGEVASGILSQILHSRKAAMLIFVAFAICGTVFVLNSQVKYYGFLCVPLGFFVGYWSVVITTTTEQFGTNLRSTATTLVPNFTRAFAIPITLLFSTLAGSLGAHTAAAITGALCFIAAVLSIVFMEETFAKDLYFTEN